MTRIVCSRPMWNRVAPDIAASVAHPVGLADVAPAPLGFQPDTNESSRSRGLSGNWRNSPTGGIPLSKKVRLPTMTPTITQIQAKTGAVVPSASAAPGVVGPT